MERVSELEIERRTNEVYKKIYWIIFNNVKKKYPNTSTTQQHVITKNFAMQKYDEIEYVVREKLRGNPNPKYDPPTVEYENYTMYCRSLDNDFDSQF